jgi:hypothetical protein
VGLVLAIGRLTATIRWCTPDRTGAGIALLNLNSLVYYLPEWGSGRTACASARLMQVKDHLEGEGDEQVRRDPYTGGGRVRCHGG